MRFTVISVLCLLLLCACTDIDNRRTESQTPTSPTTPTVTKDRVEFRVFGSGLLTSTTVKFLDPLNGLTINTVSPPYFAQVDSTDPSVFLFIEASSFGTSLSSLQVQIFVNGKLFREGASTGSVLVATASGTFRR
jgi:hypothetical protein